MDRRGPRGPYARSTGTRAALLEAARQSFVERGYEASSLRDIAERAGMSHAGLLHHFASKDELLLAVLSARDEQEREQSGATGGGLNAGREFLRELLLSHQESPGLMRLWAELTASASRSEHVAHDHFVRRYEQGRAAAAHFFRELAERGELRQPVDPEAAGVLLLAVLDGLQVQWLLDRGQDVAAGLDAFLDLLLGPPPPPTS